MPEARYTCPVLIGRDSGLAALTELWHSVHSGHGRTVLLTGEAGVGKSRLLAELIEQAQQEGALVLVGHCYPPDIDLPYAPLLDALRTYFHGFSPQEIAACLGPHASELLKLLPELSYLLPTPEGTPYVQAGNPVGPQAEKRRLFEAIYSFLSSLAAERPLLLALEDLHWADDTTLDLFHLLARRVSRDSTLLVATFRLDEPVATPGTLWLRRIADLERERLADEVRLSPLTLAEVGAMMQKIFEVDDVSSQFAQAVYTRTEGNPFFVEELLKALVESGDLFYREGSWNRTALEELKLPRSVREAILRHLDGLNARELHVVSTAAVIGRRFDFELLRAVTRLSEGEMLSDLRTLLNQQLISIEEHPGGGMSGDYRFRHALTRDAIYDRLLPQERILLHRKVAETIESLISTPTSPATSAQALDSLALHYRLAESWSKAFEYSERAGEQAQAIYAPQATISHLTRALQAAEHLSMTAPARLYRLRGQAYELLGEFDLALTDQEAALKLAMVAGDEVAEWQLLMDLGSLWAGREYATAGHYFEQALSHVRNKGIPRNLASTLNRIGNWQVNTGRPDEGLAAHQEALTIFKEEQDELGIAETLDLLGTASGLYGDAINAVSYLESAAQLFRKLGDTRMLISSLTNSISFTNPNLLDTTVSTYGTLGQCLRHSEEALRLSRQIGWLAGQSNAEFATSSAYVGYGKIGTGLIHGRESLRIATEISHQQWTAGSHHTLGKAYVALYAVDLAKSHLHSGLEIAEKVGSTWWIGNNAATLATAYLLAMDLSNAESIIRAWMPGTGRPLTLAERRLVEVSGRLALAKGDWAGALAVADKLIESAPHRQEGQPIPGGLQLKGDALLALGQAEEAQTMLELAREEAVRRNALILLSQICVSLAHLYSMTKQRDLQAGRTNQASECINRVAEDIDDASLRENFLRAAMQRLPRESPGRGRAPGTSYPFGLSAREVQVLKLVAEGKGNRQIAEELSLSEKTVENHLSSIFAKSGTNNRAGATAFAFRYGLT